MVNLMCLCGLILSQRIEVVEIVKRSKIGAKCAKTHRLGKLAHCQSGFCITKRDNPLPNITVWARSKVEQNGDKNHNSVNHQMDR